VAYGRVSGGCCEYGIECFISIKGRLYVLNSLNPSGYFMYRWFHFKQFYILPVKYIFSFVFDSQQY
jgi:hypothetical protein